MGSAQSQPIVAEVATQLPSAILESAADLIAKPGAWVQGHFASSAKGHPIGPREVGAVCWCAMGAVLKVVGNEFDTEGVAMHWLRTAVHAGGEFSSVDDWNDKPGQTQEEVAAKLREAAALAREAGQ